MPPRGGGRWGIVKLTGGSTAGGNGCFRKSNYAL